MIEDLSQIIIGAVYRIMFMHYQQYVFQKWCSCAEDRG
jgi:hypothetical protein